MLCPSSLQFALLRCRLPFGRVWIVLSHSVVRAKSILSGHVVALVCATVRAPFMQRYARKQLSFAQKTLAGQKVQKVGYLGDLLPRFPVILNVCVFCIRNP